MVGSEGKKEKEIEGVILLRENKKSRRMIKKIAAMDLCPNDVCSKRCSRKTKVDTNNHKETKTLSN